MKSFISDSVDNPTDLVLMRSRAKHGVSKDDPSRRAQERAPQDEVD
jgi:hypothetical protein